MSTPSPTPAPTSAQGGGCASWALRLVLVTLSLGGTLALLEWGARHWLHSRASESEFQVYASYGELVERLAKDTSRHKPHYYLGYTGTPDFRSAPKRGKGQGNRHNALGFRGEELPMPKPEGRFRIACLGGSTTYTTDVDDWRQAYPQLLAERLAKRTGGEVDSINAGLSSWTSYESLLNFPLRILPLEPDLVIVYHGVNDLHSRLVWPPERYTADNGGAREAVESYVLDPPLWQSSALLRIIGIKRRWMESQSTLVKVRWRSESYHADLYAEQWKTDTYPSGLFAEVSAEQVLEGNPPIHFRNNLRNLVHLAQAHGIPIVLATFAHSDKFERVPWSDAPLHQAGYVEMNRVVREVAEETGAHLFDFAAVFPNERDLYTDGIHVRTKGARLKAELFAKELLEQGLVPRRK